MSSMVTTSTVAAVSSAITLAEFGQILSLVALLLLAVGLIAREVVMLSNTKAARSWARGLDILNAPLIVVFAMIITINMVVSG